MTRRFWCLSIPSKPSANKNLKICANVTVWGGWVAILQSKPTEKYMDTYFDNYNTIPFRRDCTAFVLRRVFHMVGFKHFLNGSELYLPKKAPLF